MATELRQPPAAPVELELTEDVNRDGQPCLVGELNGTVVRAWPVRTHYDETGRKRRVWKMTVEPIGRRPPGSR